MSSIHKRTPTCSKLVPAMLAYLYWPMRGVLASGAVCTLMFSQPRTLDRRWLFCEPPQKEATISWCSLRPFAQVIRNSLVRAARHSYGPSKCQPCWLLSNLA